MQKNNSRSKDANEGPRRRSRHLEGVKLIDLQDQDLLRRFITDHGKLVPARLTGASGKQQRQIRKGVLRAREMGMLP
jgi:small subunit ribosomal protein S18